MKMDLNSDLGESLGAWRMGDDAAMLDIVSSANVACGFHAGDAAGILRTLADARARGVAIGAHVSYPDLAGFGRRAMDVASADLVADVIYQIGALQGLARAAGTRVGYVKPHGALYNTIAHDARQADDVIAGIRAIDPDLVLVGLAGSPLLDRARAIGLVGAVGEGRAPCCTMPTWSRPACCAWRPRAWSPPSTAARCICGPTRSACMATAPARSRWRAGCARRWRAPASR
jgi:UPF0271 protein